MTANPLPSWNDGAARRRIVDFVAIVTEQGSATFVPPSARIAVFDNDGTLWCELVAALTFQLAADIVRTTISPTWADVGKTGAIAVIRTFLTYFLDRDMVQIRGRREQNA